MQGDRVSSSRPPQSPAIKLKVSLFSSLKSVCKASSFDSVIWRRPARRDDAGGKSLAGSKRQPCHRDTT